MSDRTRAVRPLPAVSGSESAQLGVVMVALLKMPNPFAAAAGLGRGSDRRMFPRKEINARIDGLRHDHTIAAHRQPQLSLHLRDLSLGGLSAISQTPLDSGEKLTVFFPPQGTKRGWDA